jgi:hypothetical protein
VKLQIAKYANFFYDRTMTRDEFWEFFPFMFSVASMFATMFLYPRLSRPKDNEKPEEGTLKGKWAWMARAVTLLLLGAVCYYGWYLGKLQRDLFGS